jgi:hypothetical protein
LYRRMMTLEQTGLAGPHAPHDLVVRDGKIPGVLSPAMRDSSSS